LGSELGIDLFDRTLVAFKQDEHVFTISSSELKAKLSDGVWNGDSLLFNNLVGTKGDLTQTWLVPAGRSWLKRYLPKQTLAG
jgi:hypothetical protein